VYREIQESFEGADAVADAARRIADADGDAFERLYEEAGTHADRSRSGDDFEEAVDSDAGNADDDIRETADGSGGTPE
jgi:prephenate dehydrogenase